MKNNKQKVDKEITCSSCGAHFSIHKEYCPYCGSVNEYGDEEQYFRDLEDIRDNLEDTVDIQDDIIKKEAKRSYKIAFIVMAVILLAALSLGIIVFVATKVITVISDKNIEKQMEWEAETFAMLDEMYDSGDIEGACDYIENLYVEGTYSKYGNIWSWKHYQFISAYMDMRRIRNYELEMADGTIEDFGRNYSFQMMMAILYERWDLKYENVKSITKSEYDQIKEYQTEVRKILNKYYNLSDEDIDALKTQVTFDPPGEGVDYTKCNKVYESLFKN